MGYAGIVTCLLPSVKRGFEKMTEVTETGHLMCRPFVTAEDRSATRYPNLVELYKYYPCGEPAMCDHAGIEPELLYAVLRNGERLELQELLGFARLYGCSMGVLKCQKVIMLDRTRWKHRKMIADVDSLYIRLKCMAREGNEEAEGYLKLAEWAQQEFLRSAHINRVSYCHYLGTKEKIQQYISFSTPLPQRRGLSSMKGGVS
jgi:hypothetical protein